MQLTINETGAKKVKENLVNLCDCERYPIRFIEKEIKRHLTGSGIIKLLTFSNQLI